jgi:subtilisin family serine protease
MPAYEDRDPLRRRTSYDRFEDRLVLSAQPWADPALAALSADAVPASVGQASTARDPAQQLAEDLAYIRQRYGLNGEGQTVAVIDSGIAYDHLALGAGYGPGFRVVGGWDFTEENDANPYDDGPAGFHGTHVAGIIGSSDAQYPGAATGVDFVALRVFNDQGVGRFPWVEKALQWVHENRDAFASPITTVNLSFGANLEPENTAPYEMFEDEFAQLKADGIFVAVAAGNSFDLGDIDGLTYPASSRHVVPVGSLDVGGQLSDFSQRDARILAAPGEQITSTVPSHLFGGGLVADDFAPAYGTSQATPFVTGAGVLVREAMQKAGYDQITPDMISQHLWDTADEFRDAPTGQVYHRLNVRRAIDALLAAPASDSAAASPAVTRVGGLVRVSGTAGQDTFEFFAGPTWRVVANGATYHFESSSIERIEVQGLGGEDQLRVEGNDTGDETVQIRPGSVEWSGGGIKLQAAEVEDITIRARGSYATASLHDSPGDETLRAYPNRAELEGTAFRAAVEGFARIEVLADQGGDDTAHLFDSPASDRLYAYPTHSVLTGMGFRNQVEGFDRVVAYAEAGGNDVAYFYDSSHNDRFYDRSEYALMTGLGYANRAIAFERVYAYATLGGSDEAFLYDTPGDDRFNGRGTYASFSGLGRQSSLHGFDRVSAYSVAGGEDRAIFDDTPGDDRFNGYPTYAAMSGMGYYNYARGFRHFSAVASGGRDSAQLHGSFADETLDSANGVTELRGRSFRLSAEQFESVRASGGGGHDQATLRDVELGDRVSGRGAWASIENSNSIRTAEEFAEVILIGDQVKADLTALEYVFRQAGQ